MVHFVISVIDISEPKFTKTSGGGYSSVDVAFKRDGKVDGKKLVSFSSKDNPNGDQVYKFFTELTGGESVSVTAEKGEKFWNWVDASLITGESAKGATAPESNPKPADSNDTDKSGGRKAGPERGRVTGSNYETPEERAIRREADRVRQYYIVRQSSIGAAIELLKASTTTSHTGTSSHTPITVDQVIETAKKFENFVFGLVPVVDQKDDVPF